MQAGRLEVPVSAALEGFARELRTKVEAAAEGLAVKIAVEVSKKGLRKRLETVVKEAAAGVKATVRVDLDRDHLRGELEEAASIARHTNISVPIRADGGDGRRGGGGGGGLVSRIRSMIGEADGEAQRRPVQVPVNLRMPKGRRGLRGLLLPAIVSLAQPAVSALMQLGTGLTALVSAAAPAVGVVGALPGLISAAGMAAIGTVVGFKGFGAALDQSAQMAQRHAAGMKVTKSEQLKLNAALVGLSPSARIAVAAIGSLQGAWAKVRTSVQEKLFSGFAKDIEPAAKTILPLLSKSLGDAAGQMGAMIGRGAKWMQTGVFRKDFAAISSTNSRVIGNITGALGNLGHTTEDFLVASGPFTQRIGQAAEGWTQWLRAATATGRADGTIEGFLDRAGKKAAQLGRATADLGHGLAGMGRAANAEGEALLKGLEWQAKRFNLWSNSDKGQASQKAFFDQSLPAYREMLALIGDIGKGLARMATDNGLVDVIHQLRTELLPGLGGFLNEVGRGLGPQVISLLSSLAAVLRQVAAAGLGIALIAKVFADVTSEAAALLRVVPGLSMGLATLLTVMLSLKIMRSIGGIFGSLTTNVRTSAAAMTSMGGATRAVTGQTPILARMLNAYRGAANNAGTSNRVLAGTTAAVRGGMRGLQGVGGSLSSFFGGPWGIALAAASIGLSLLANHQREAAQAAQQHRTDVETLAQALRDSGGAIDANVRATAAKLLQDNNLSESAGKAKVSLLELTDAALGQGDSLEALEKRMRAYAKSTEHWESNGKIDQLKMTEAGQNAKDFADALADQSGLLDDAVKKNREYGLAVNGASASGATAYGQLKTAVAGLSTSTADADTRTKSLKAALDALTGRATDFHDAQTRVNAAVLAAEDVMTGAIDKTKGYGAALLASDGSVKTSTRNGQQLNSTLDELRDSAVNAATAAYDMATKGGKPMTEALAAARGEMTKSRDSAIKLAQSFGLGEKDAARLATQLGLVPETVEVLLQTKGLSQSNADLLTLQTRLLGLPPGQEIRITAPNEEAVQALRAVGIAVNYIPKSHEVVIAAPTAAARSNLAALVNSIGSVPDGKSVTVAAIVRQSIGDLQAVRDSINAVPAGKDVRVTAPTDLARRALTDLGYVVETIPGTKDVRVTAPVDRPMAALQALQNRIDSLTGTTVHNTVVTDWVSNGTAEKVKGGRYANGGIVRAYADGAIRRASGALKAFANGSERHIAQIARAGEMRLWAEPETGGEAYIPLARSKRARSESILESVANMFGGHVSYFANGGAMAYQASAAADLYRSTRSSSSRTTAPQGAAGSLIGGDLNLNLTSTPTTPGEALQDAMFELRRIKRGGAHVATG
nr:hypothetical protein [Streptomyces sp. SID13666]